MQRERQHIGIRIFLLALFMSYFVGITFFTHKHIIEGEVVVHSHFVKQPFSSASSQLPDHSHSLQLLDLISNLTSWSSNDFEQTELPGDTWTTLPQQLCEQFFFTPNSCREQYYLRGPPKLIHFV